MAENRFHAAMSAEQLHGVVRWTVATYADLDALTPADEDVGKVALVEEGPSLHAAMVITSEGVTWARLDNESLPDPILLSDSPALPVSAPDDESAGSAGEAARADHRHALGTIIRWYASSLGEIDPEPQHEGSIARVEVDGNVSLYMLVRSQPDNLYWQRLDNEPQLKAPLLVPTRTITGAAATLALGDVGGSLLCDSATQQAITVPSAAMVPIPVGAMILIVQLGIGSVVIASAAGVTLRSSASTPLQTRAQYAPPVSVWKIATDTWLVSGGLY